MIKDYIIFSNTFNFVFVFILIGSIIVVSSEDSELNGRDYLMIGVTSFGLTTLWLVVMLTILSSKPPLVSEYQLSVPGETVQMFIDYEYQLDLRADALVIGGDDFSNSIKSSEIELIKKAFSDSEGLILVEGDLSYSLTINVQEVNKFLFWEFESIEITLVIDVR